MSTEREHRMSTNLARIKLPRDEGALMSYGTMCVKIGMFTGKRECLREIATLKTALARCDAALDRIDYIASRGDVDDLKQDVKDLLNK